METRLPTMMSKVKIGEESGITSNRGPRHIISMKILIIVVIVKTADCLGGSPKCLSARAKSHPDDAIRNREGNANETKEKG